MSKFIVARNGAFRKRTHSSANGYYDLHETPEKAIAKVIRENGINPDQITDIAHFEKDEGGSGRVHIFYRTERSKLLKSDMQDLIQELDKRPELRTGRVIEFDPDSPPATREHLEAIRNFLGCEFIRISGVGQQLLTVAFYKDAREYLLTLEGHEAS